MSGVTIGTLNTDNEIQHNLLQEINFLNREGIKVKLTQRNVGKFVFLNCSINENDQNLKTSHEKILRYYLANIITDLLMNGLTKEYIHRFVRSKYKYLAPVELNTIVQRAYTYLSNLHDDGDIGETLIRHNHILTEVNKYLDSNSNLFLEGFLRFRLKNYCQEMVSSVENAVDNYMVEREYEEFIKLLRYFVEIQEPRLREVHVLIKDKQVYHLLDEAKNPVDQHQLQGILSVLNQEIDYDDLLLSALITMAPQSIVLHVVVKIEVVDTIKSIFQERVIVCPGCVLCQLH